MEDFSGENLTLRELLGIQASVRAELRARNLIRGNNAPIGDIAEYLVLKARGGALEDNSAKSHDIVDSSGVKIQVKARAMKKNSQKFSAFRSFDFDIAIFIVFDPDTYELTWAREVAPAELKESSNWQTHTNSFTVTGSKVQKLGRDITEEIAGVYESL